MFLRTHHDVEFLIRGAHVAGQRGSMSEAVDVVGDLGRDAELALEVVQAERDLPLETEAAGRIAVRLNPPADNLPAARGDVGADAREQLGIDRLDLLEDPGFALGEAREWV